MSPKPLALALSAALILNACATHQYAQHTSDIAPSYTPLIDRQGVTDETKMNNDIYDCRAYAGQVSGSGDNALLGAGLGLLLGFALGKANGLSNHDSAEIGRTGLLAGAVGGAGKGYQSQVDVIRNCLTGRGYRVLN